MEAMNKVADEIDASVKKLPDEELDRISHPPRVVKLNPDAINTDPVEVQFFDLRLKKKGW
jgi:hypothetical protein